MLEARVLTAVVLAPLVLAAVWLLPTAAVGTLFAAITLLAGWEWGELMKADGPLRIGWMLGLLAALGLGGWLLTVPGAALWIFAGTAFGWALVAAVILRARRGLPVRVPSPAGWFALGLFILWPAWLALTYMHGQLPEGALWIVLLMLLVWGADTGAYFAGSTWGRTRLAPAVSPGKTVEGVAGGAVTALAAGVLFVLWAVPERPSWTVLLVLMAAVIAVSVVGDLLESLLKRQQQVKDSGGLLPGHGGLLDRVDSLTAAAPVLAAGLAAWHATL